LRDGLDIGTDFAFNPRKLFCKTHPNLEVEYCNEISGNFYCKTCRSKYQGQDDKVLSSICRDIQTTLSELKSNYMVKKQTLVTKLDRNQKSMEELFNYYYNTLDSIRNEILAEEYKLRDKMNVFETELK
jgi:hypothetical protein